MFIENSIFKMGSSWWSSKIRIKSGANVKNPESLAEWYFGTPKYPNRLKKQINEDSKKLYIGDYFMFNELFCHNRKSKEIKKLFSRKK